MNLSEEAQSSLEKLRKKTNKAKAQTQAQAMEDAANNSAGAMTGFMGMGFAQQAGGMNNIGNLYGMGVEQQAQAAQQAAPAAEEWKCSCGAAATGKFCLSFKKKRPTAVFRFVLFRKSK